MFKIASTMQTRTVSELPVEFDGAYYRKRYPDLRRLSSHELESHYRSMGTIEGRQASPIASRAEFMQMAARSESVLEIGPFGNPALRGPNVSYFDVLTTENLRQRAVKHGVNPADCPNIDYVSEFGDLSVVDRTFSTVLSSHVIEHQPDLIWHLQGVAKLLEPEGRYFLAVPDKRFCFDHFIAESSIAEVVDAHVREVRKHDVRSLIEHRGLTTHNDALRHWNGDHGQPKYKAIPESIQSALDLFLFDTSTYIDTHAWQFTPETFRDILTILCRLGLSPFAVSRVYATNFGSNEFYAVLSKLEQPCAPLRSSVPEDFSEADYLAANPDVAAAGMNAAEHYLCYGRTEGRKLRL